MLRWMMVSLVAVFMIGTAAAADGPVVKHSAAPAAAGKLPAGFPRAHYKYRTTISRRAPPPYGRRVYIETEPEVLFTPMDSEPAIRTPYVAGTPLLPGSSTLPGYYGTSHSYGYQGPYYGGKDFGFWDRLPYACGVYGYC